MGVLDWIELAARRRMPDDERLRQESFLADIEDASPPLARSWRGRIAHLRASTECGPITLAQVGLAGFVAALGGAILMLAGTPKTAYYDSDPAAWSEPLVSIGVFLLAVECCRHPHVVQRSRTTFAAFALGAIGALAGAMTVARQVRGPDDLLVAALAIIGAGASITLIGLVTGTRRGVAVGLKVVGVGGFGIFLADGAWVAIFMADNDAVPAVGSFASAAGALILANGLIASRPEIRLRARS